MALAGLQQLGHLPERLNVHCCNASLSDMCLPCMQLQSLMYLRKTVGSAVKWPSLGFNKWDTSRKAGKQPA